MRDFWIFRSLSLELLEAYGLPDDDSIDCFATLDGIPVPDFRASLIYDSGNRYFCGPTAQLDQANDFRKLRICIQRNTKKGQSLPYGVITIPKFSITSPWEGWASIQAPVSQKDLGEILVSFCYRPEKAGQEGRLVTHIARAKKLTGSHNTVITIHSSNDLTMSFESTMVAETQSPEFEESFALSLPVNPNPVKIYISAWDCERRSGARESLGFAVVQVAEINVHGGEWTTWLKLQSYEKISDSTVTPTDLITREEMGSYFAPFPQAHRIQESRVLSKKCCICSGMILGRSLACGTCQIHLHHACHEHLPSECCKMGAVHFKAHCEESVVLSLKDYAPLIQLIQWDEFEVLITLRHQLISHDEAVTGIMTILDAEGQAVSFLKRLIQVETEEATDSSLLFRSNSLLTRAWTAFMGLHGQEFLTNVLNPILLSFLDLEMDIEIDPSKVNNDFRSLNENQWNLELICELLLTSIRQNLHLLPIGSHAILFALKQEIDRKFANIPNASYRAIGGFLFLRFLIPAILSPSVGLLASDSKGQRKLKLIGKTLQMLCSFKDVNRTDSFMVILSGFICANQPKLRQLLQMAACQDLSLTITTPKELVDARELSFTASKFVKFLDGLPNHSLLDYHRLPELEAIFRSVERKLARVKESVENGTLSSDDLLMQDPTELEPFRVFVAGRRAFYGRE